MPDFFAVSKIIPLLLYPMPLILLLIFVLSWRLSKNRARWSIRALVVLLWVIATPWFADVVSQWWETPLRTRSQLPAVSDVAVVLGGLSNPVTSTPEHLEFSQAAERLTEAVSLWREGRVKSLLITSGSGDLMNQAAVEAPGLAAWARSMGVPADAVLTEAKSRNTHENAVFSLAIAKEHADRSFVLITSAVHMPRSAAIFRKEGYDKDGRSLTLWPVDSQRSGARFPFNAVPDPGALTTVQNVLREAVGYLVYRLRGYL